MCSLVLSDVESLQALHGEITHGQFAGQGEHAAVVIAIGVPIEEIEAAGAIEGGEAISVASFAHVDHALEHPNTLPRGQVVPFDSCSQAFLTVRK